MESTIGPESCRLYPLRPCGLGTAFVESLTSYTIRLARAHNLMTWRLVVREFAPYFRRGSLLDDRGHCDLFAKVGSSINGLAGLAAEAVDILKVLTGQNDLQNLTLLPIRNILSPRSSVRLRSAWCPKCFQELRDHNLEIYEPLLWHLKAVKLCPVHTGVLLRESCPHCLCKHFPIERDSTPGFCPKCQKWLGVDLVPEVSMNQNATDQRITDDCANLIGSVVSGKCLPSLACLRENLKSVLHFEYGGSVNAFARNACIHHSSLNALLIGPARPGLDTLLQIAIASGFSARTLLGEVKLDSVFKRFSHKVRDKHRSCQKYDWQRILGLIQREITQNNASSSLHSICEDRGWDSGYVAKLTPSAKVLIKLFREKTSKQHRKRVEDEFGNLQVAISCLALLSRYPSYRRLRNALPSPGSLRSPKMVAFRKQLLAKDFMDGIGFDNSFGLTNYGGQSLSGS